MTVYLPPPGPPPPLPTLDVPQVSRPPLRKHTKALPYSIDLNLLASRGWVSLPFTSDTCANDPLYQSFSSLFSSSALFFNQPSSQKDKYRVKAIKSSQVSEEGYSTVDSEKCMITIRKDDTTPEDFELRKKAREAWSVGVGLVRDVLGAIEESLEMEAGSLERLVGPEPQVDGGSSAGEMPGQGEENIATLLRMFRYERPQATSTGDSTDPDGQSIPPSKVVASPHKDLGLLSLVIGHTPGLECWDPETQNWVSCEADADTDSGAEAGTRPNPPLKATLMAGQTLAKFTNWRYQAAPHRVFVHASSDPNTLDASQSLTSPVESNDADNATSLTTKATHLLSSPSHRFSLVLAVRGHHPIPVSSSTFTTPITGPIPPELQFSNVTVGEIYDAICSAHWSVNVPIDERRRQERALAERRERERVMWEQQQQQQQRRQVESGENMTSAGDMVKSASSRKRFSLLSLFKRVSSRNIQT